MNSGSVVESRQIRCEENRRLAFDVVPQPSLCFPPTQVQRGCYVGGPQMGQVCARFIDGTTLKVILENF